MLALENDWMHCGIFLVGDGRWLRATGKSQ
jgi:hypothetical protein